MTQRTRIMGVLNVTPDSFSDGGRFVGVDAAVAHALTMLAAGADIIDIGGESTRPGAAAVDAETERRRVVPVIERLVAEVPDIMISVDTTKASVARAGLDAGARMVNDVSGLGFEPELAAVVADYGAEVVIMHIQGTPATMQRSPTYDDVVGDVIAYLRERSEFAIAAGVAADRIIVDPGVGFGKTLEQNLEILRRLDEFGSLGFPVLVGTSRKSFIGALTGRPADGREFGTAATVALAVAKGAAIVRVHDVAAMVDVVRVAEAIVGSRPA